MQPRPIARLFRRITLVFSLFGGLAFQDPNDLLRKIRLRLAQKGIVLPSFVLRTSSPLGETLYEAGELTKSANEFHSAGWFGKLRAYKLRSQLHELGMPIKSGVVRKAMHGAESKPRVMFFLTNAKPYTNSGYTERTQFLLKNLLRCGVPVEGITRLGYPILVGFFPVNEEVVVDGVKYRFLLPRFYPLKKQAQVEIAVDLLVKEAKKFQATALHTTTDFKNAVIVSRVAERLGIPWIYEVRGELEKTWLSKRPALISDAAATSEFFSLAEQQETEAMKQANAVIALSEVSKSQMIRRGIPSEKILVVPNAISEEEVTRRFNRDNIRSELNLGNGKIIGAITSLVGYEGIDDLIRAVRHLPDLECIIVGDGESKMRLEVLARELNVSDRVYFKGKQPFDAIWKWYAALDVLVVPRKNHEVTRAVTPIKTLMAQALGTPVVASDLPALREVTGGLAEYCTAEDPASIAAAVERVLKFDVQSRERLASDGREWVRTRTWHHNAERLSDLYVSISAKPDLEF